MYNKRKQIFILLALTIIVVIAIVIAATIIGRQRTIAVQTDFTPVKFELNNQTYSINRKSYTLRVSPGIYTYRAIAMIDGKYFVTTDKLDLTPTKKASLKLNFSLYSKASISRALCGQQQQETCPFSPDALKITYLEGYQWAVVFINSATLGKAKAVLNIDNGKWKVIDLGTDIPVLGYYPQSVEEALLHDQ